jgi:hypothetical protein
MNHALRAFIRGTRMDTVTSSPGFVLAQPLIAWASSLIPLFKVVGDLKPVVKIPIAVKISPCVIRTL